MSSSIKKITIGISLIVAAIGLLVWYGVAPIRALHWYAGEIELFVPYYKVENARVVTDSLGCECVIYRDRDDGALIKKDGGLAQMTCKLIAETGYTKLYLYKWWARPERVCIVFMLLIGFGFYLTSYGVGERSQKKQNDNTCEN